MSRFSMSEPEEVLMRGGNAETPTRDSTRASIAETLKGCGIATGLRVDKEDLRRRILIPGRLRAAMAEAMRSKDPAPALVPLRRLQRRFNRGSRWEDVAPEAPIVVFVNSRSGGRLGPIVKARLLDLVGNAQVFDLAEMKPSDFLEYGLVCLEKLADLGDYCAKSTRQNMRVMVAGGDGTVGWVLGSLDELHAQCREPIPPTGIIPLGTGNDLSRSFGWGGSFPFAWKSLVKRCLFRAATGPISHLDSWHVLVSLSDGEAIDIPHSLRHTGEHTFTQEVEGDVEAEWPDKITCLEGVFYNYFSIGMDAQVAYGFHHFREEKPHLAQSPIANKLIYTGYSCAQGWFVTPCTSDPTLRGLNNILRLSIKKINSPNWEHIRVPSSVRAIVALNLHNYGSGRNPWGSPKPEYLLKKGFVEAQYDDGLLEIFGLKQGWHASFVMVELISAKHIAQAAAIRLEIRGGTWNHAYMQMDGEPWKQRISSEYSSFVEITRVPHQSLIIRGD
ncbi:Diacylglycerol kinase 4 [Platanthera guangdongensis]|uniref:Diacylglycerol kinase n=1 Tax=Platanthera guangdongensis TaxID=2320717 RepID=A0ABR2MM37_9ASPA